MPLYDVRCDNGHEAEAWAKFDERDIPCGVCGASTVRLWRAHAVRGDEIDETHRDLDAHGGVIRFRSRQEKQRYMDAHNIRPFVRWAGAHDQHVTRWAAMDQYTLDAAKALVSRAGAKGESTPDDVPCETFKWSAEAK